MHDSLLFTKFICYVFIYFLVSWHNFFLNSITYNNYNITMHTICVKCLEIGKGLYIEKIMSFKLGPRLYRVFTGPIYNRTNIYHNWVLALISDMNTKKKSSQITQNYWSCKIAKSQTQICKHVRFVRFVRFNFIDSFLDSVVPWHYWECTQWLNSESRAKSQTMLDK